MPDKKRLLLIEDDLDIVRGIGRFAGRIGWEFESACGWGEIREALSRFQPHVVVLDLAMPEADGVQVLHYLATVKRIQFKVLLVSGVETRIVSTCKRLGAELGLEVIGALGKPVDLQELEEALNRESHESRIVVRKATAAEACKQILGCAACSEGAEFRLS